MCGRSNLRLLCLGLRLRCEAAHDGCAVGKIRLGHAARFAAHRDASIGSVSLFQLADATDFFRMCEVVYVSSLCVCMRALFTEEIDACGRASEPRCGNPKQRASI